MIVLGPVNCIQYLGGDFVIFNYSSPIEGLDKLNLMPPMFDWSSELDFDIWYANWLLADPIAFRDLMRLMYVIYNGMNVFLCASIIDALEPVNESFVKFIQQRYGINCFVINDPTDLECVHDYGAGFTIEGIANFDIDKERASLIAMENSETNKSNHEFDFMMVKNDDRSEYVTYGPN